MAIANERVSLKIPNLTDCSICLKTFKEPKVLPCIHTFCLQCLDAYCANKKHDEIVCPLCRKIFSIPTGGIKDVPDNIFIHQLLQINNSTASIGAEESDKPIPCELCSDVEAEVPSTSYCIECDQHICDRCSVMHKKANVSKSHQVVRDADMPSAEERLRQKVSYCDQHPSELNRLYCYDCKMVICSKCIPIIHSQHKLTDVNYSAENFREQLSDDVTKMSAFSNSKQLQLTQLETDRNSFLKNIESTESAITQKYDELMSLLQSHKSQLMKELNEHKGKVVKDMENKTDKIERQFVITESFKRYCQEMINKGTACDISRTAYDLRARAEELVKTQDEPDWPKLQDIDVTLKPYCPTTDNIKNFIGQLAADGETLSDTMNDQKMCLKKFLDKTTLLHVMPTSGNPITGITVLGSEVFVVRDPSQKVDVYKSESFCYSHQFVIFGSKNLIGITSCSQYNCLYITDCRRNKIYNYDVRNKVTTSWQLNEKCYGLSVNKCYNVLATLHGSKQILEYTTHGSLLRQINLDPSIDCPRHCIQLSTGNYVVSHAGTEYHRVCIVDQSGHIIQSYGGTSGSDVEQLKNPRNLCVDAYDNVLVADWKNDRVQLLSPSLTYLGEIKILEHELKQPYALGLDKLNHRLYIGRYSSGSTCMYGLNVFIQDEK